jgi:transposase InsO family protein
MTRERVASLIGTTTESLRHWVAQAHASGAMPVVPQVRIGAEEKASAKGATTVAEPPSPYAPRDPGQGLSEIEVAAILEYKKKHPSMGPAQIRAQLKRFKGWRVAVKAIARVLRAHGYEPVHRGSRPQGPEPQRFEAPRRNALWQMDFTELRVDGEHVHLLVVEDDFSRYVVGHELADSPAAEVAVRVLRAAIARHGKPEAVRTDRGGAFNAAEFTGFLEAELIDHIVGHSYHPQGGGKVESVIGTVKRELWEVEHFHSRAEATRRLGEFFVHYNHRRAHMGIDGLTPADRYFGRGAEVLAAVDALSRKRQGALQMLGAPGSASEEVLTSHTGAPMEVLRLVIVDGEVELRFCGARVHLGALIN